MSEHIADINTVTDEEVTLDHNRNMPHEKATADTTAVREKNVELSWHLNRIDKNICKIKISVHDLNMHCE